MNIVRIGIEGVCKIHIISKYVFFASKNVFWVWENNNGSAIVLETIPRRYLPKIKLKVPGFKRQASVKVWRTDIGLWETKLLIGYKYQIFGEKDRFSLFRKSQSTARVMIKPYVFA